MKTEQPELQEAQKHRDVRGPSWLRYIVISLGVAGIYLLLGRLGFSFAPEGIDTAPTWPPSGFATAVLFIFGLRYLPAISLGSITVGILYSGLSPIGTVILSVVDTAEAFTAVMLLRLLAFRPEFARVRDVVLFSAATALGSSALAATLGTLTFAVEGQVPWSEYWEAWVVYWIANSTANFTLAPLLLTWSAPRGDCYRELWRRKYAIPEALALLVTSTTLGVLTWLVESQRLILDIEYLLYPPLMWAGFRFGPRGASLTIAFVSFVALYGTSQRLGVFSEHPTYSAIFMVQMYIGIYALTGLVVAAAAEERADAQRQVTRTLDNLETTIAERTHSLVKANSFLEAVLDNVSSAIIAVDAQGNLFRYNRAAGDAYGRLSGYSQSMENWAEDFQLYKADGKTLLREKDVPLARALRGEIIRNVELATKTPEQDTRYILVSGQPILHEDNRIGGAVIVAHDITDRKKAQKLQRLFNRAAVTANEAPDKEQAVLSILEIVCIYTGWPIGHAFNIENYKGRRAAVSTNWWHMADTSRLRAFQSASDQRFFEGDDLPGRVLASGHAEWLDVATESKIPRLAKLGKPQVVSAIAFPVTAESKVVGILEFFTYTRVEPDVQLLDSMKFVCTQLGRVYERADATQNLMNMTLRDPLTGLPNRLAFVDVLRQAIAHAKRRENYSFAVLFLDLDRFKLINDSLGHAAGDQVLRETAARIQKCLREGDALARLGGDEFTILLDDLGQRSDGANAAKVARRINEEIAKPYIVDGEEVFISSSIGIVISNPEYDDPHALLRDADSAMYRAKAAGKSRVENFSSQMHTQAMSQLRLESDLRRALERNEFLLQYQPIVSMETGALVGFESLVRWKHPDRGLVSPAEFIPVCEETGLIVPLGQWVMLEACQWLTRLNQKSPAAAKLLTISVNVSGIQFSKGMVAAQVQKALSQTNVTARQLKLEIVESTLLKNPIEAVYAMESLRALGVQVMIDDFGTGYSSLSYLSRLPIDALKIDRSFVNDMSQNENSAEVVRCIISMAAALRLDVVAEGIERHEQAEALKKLGCTFGQGYFYSKPLAADTAAELAISSANKNPA